jgi:hypothetical protein
MDSLSVLNKITDDLFHELDKTYKIKFHFLSIDSKSNEAISEVNKAIILIDKE